MRVEGKTEKAFECNPTSDSKSSQLLRKMTEGLSIAAPKSLASRVSVLKESNIFKLKKK